MSGGAEGRAATGGGDASPARPGAYEVFLLLVLLIGGWFLATVAFPYLTLEAETLGRFAPKPGWLIAHIAGGTVALLLGPVQFWLARGGRRWRIHRWTGRVYAAAVVLGAVPAFHLAWTNDISWSFGLGLGCLGGAWLLTTAMAWTAIRADRIDQHREWVVRSYVVTFGFVTFRVFLGVGRMFEWADPTEIAIGAAWISWTVPLLLAEAVLQGRKILRPPATSSRM